LLMERGKPSENRKRLKINPVQSRPCDLRRKSQNYWVMGVGVMVCWERK